MNEIARQLRRRRAASWRLVPLKDGRQDPMDVRQLPHLPSSFGLTAVELRREAGRCRAAGWDVWEVWARFDREAA